MMASGQENQFQAIWHIIQHEERIQGCIDTKITLKVLSVT